jgi:D-alanyl-D-alanine carboxypeptidase
MKKYYLLILSVILNSTLSYAGSDLKGKIGAASSEYLSSHFMNGVYMFCDADGVIDKGAKGIHSLAGKKELQPLQQMPIASATKTMTAAGILKLQDKGLLDVQDTVAKHLSTKSGIWKDGKIPAWARQVKIHNLLTHRSGLPEYFMAIELDVKKPHAEINKDIANFAANSKLASEPGQKHHYCNTNFVLLGLIIEQASGIKLGKFYDREFFGPLGMIDTRLLTLAEAVQQQIKPETMSFPTRYFVTPTNADPEFNEAKSKFLMVPFADGGVVSTTHDLVIWHQALHTGKVISDNAYNLMTTRHYEVVDRTGVNNYIGYGLYISELQGGDVLYHHAGSAVAIRSESGCIPKKNICFAVLSNVMDYIPKEMQDKVDIAKVENQLDILHFVQYIFKAIR